MSDPHLLLTHPYSLTLPHRLTGIPSWHEHIPFAFALVAAIQPRVLVELGTYRGDSFCAFCQVVDGLALPTACYAVDSWQGDDHAGRYGEEVLEELRGYHDPRYGRFSQLIRSSFDDARRHFADGSVDLLHIDGLHTLEAVAHDFESWKAKLSDRAVVLLHDINVREREFGVWRLWKELAGRHPGFAFVHGHGLGVLAVGAKAPAEVLALCALPAEGQAVIRDRFAALGSRVGLMGQLELASERLRDAAARLAASEQGRAGRDQRVQVLEKEAGQLQATAAELKQRLRLAEAGARILQERVQAGEGLARGLQRELERLSGIIVEGNRLTLEGNRLIAEASRGRVDRLVGWVKKNNRIRLARRKARRGELLYGQDPRLSLPGPTAVTGHGPIAWLRRRNRARLARRKHPLEATPPLEVAPLDLVKAPADLEAFARGLELPAVIVPKFSIIVPVLDHLRDTLECLASVVRHTPSNDYEIFVIDDGSTDQTATVLPLVKGLRYLRNETSEGFLVCCNRSAAMARGEFLVFLDGAAQVTPGWLMPLLYALAWLDWMGAAGPKLLDPDGRLLEAGAMIDPGLGVTAVGAGDEPGKARSGQPHEVQYCPGTCLLMTRRHFDAVGGFSEALESLDSGFRDLQLRLRKAGMRIIYQPGSVVVHRRGGSSQGPPQLAG